MKGTFLLFIFFILSIILLPIAFLLIHIILIKENQNGRYNEDLAEAGDAFGGAVLKHILNKYFIKHEGYKFGYRGETISSCMGKNLRDNTFLPIGEKLREIIDVGFGKNHCIEAIDEKRNW